MVDESPRKSDRAPDAMSADAGIAVVMPTMLGPFETRAGARTMALCESEGNLRAILAAAVDAIITSDQHGTIVHVNPAAVRMFGYTEAELVGQKVNVLMPSPFREEHDDYVGNYLRTGKAKVIGSGRETEGRHKNGSPLPVDLTISTFHGDRGPMFTAILRDISQRKLLEKRLNMARLDEQARIARDLHDGLGGLITGIGMLAKTLHVSLARANSPMAEQAASLTTYLGDAEAKVQQMARGLMPVHAAPDGLLPVLQRLAARHHTPTRPCRVVSPCAIVIRDVNAVDHLYHIAQEAVVNAIRHGQPSQVTIELTKQGELVALSICDDGSGIDEPQHKTGLGLQTMSYRAAQIGGTLTIAPAEDRGTRVTCRFRLPPVHPAAEPKL